MAQFDQPIRAPQGAIRLDGHPPIAKSVKKVPTYPGWVNEEATLDEELVRTAEVIGASCPATDRVMGLPFEHGLHATLMAMELADLVGVDSETASQAYYA